jgi:hypothetical protein
VLRTRGNKNLGKAIFWQYGELKFQNFPLHGLVPHGHEPKEITFPHKIFQNLTGLGLLDSELNKINYKHNFYLFRLLSSDNII